MISDVGSLLGGISGLEEDEYALEAETFVL